MIDCAAVEKIEELRKPDDFFGHRKRERTNLRKIYPKINYDRFAETVIS